jgi:hypothetical protein
LFFQRFLGPEPEEDMFLPPADLEPKKVAAVIEVKPPLQQPILASQEQPLTTPPSAKSRSILFQKLKRIGSFNTLKLAQPPLPPVVLPEEPEEEESDGEPEDLHPSNSNSFTPIATLSNKVEDLYFLLMFSNSGCRMTSVNSVMIAKRLSLRLNESITVEFVVKCSVGSI